MTDFTDKLDAYKAAQTDDGALVARAAVVALWTAQEARIAEINAAWATAIDTADQYHAERNAERTRAEAAEKALQGDADKITQSLVDQLAANKRLLDAARAELTELHSEFRQQNSDFCDALTALYDKRAELARVRGACQAIHDRFILALGRGEQATGDLVSELACLATAALKGDV